MSDDTHPGDMERKSEKEDVPAIRDTQGPMGQPASKAGTSVAGDDQDDPLRDEAAERASRAVEPGRPRE